LQTATAARLQRALPVARPRLPLWGPLALACLVVGGFLKWPEAAVAPGPDTGMFATYGAMLLRGARPYVDFWDLHPPLVFVYWTLVQFLGAGEWPRTALIAHTLDLLLSVLAALVVAAITRRAGGSRASAAFAALLVVGFADQVMLSQEGSNPSKLTLLPACVAVWAYLVSLGETRGARWAFAAGVAGAIAVLAKQPAALTLAALAAHAIWVSDRRRLVGLLIGGAATMALACIALAAVGSLSGFIDQAWIYNVERALMGYFASPAKPPVITLVRVLLESAGALAALGVIGATLLIRTRGGRYLGVLLAWALLNVLAIIVFREFVYVVPSFAVVAALGLERVWRSSTMPSRVLVGLGCAVCLLFTTSFQRAQLARARFERDALPPAIVLAPHSDELELNLADYPAMRALLQDCYAPQTVSPELDAQWGLLLLSGACAPVAASR
jgi:dolichol phosphate-mannose mannosyltransferase